MTDWRFTLTRTVKFMRTLFKSKMAIFGLIILILFSFVALAAPLITPYSPDTDVVSSQYAHPTWYRYFPGGRGLSENTVLESTAGFRTDPSLEGGWQFTTDSGHHTSESFDPSTSSLPGSGSVKLTFDRNSGPVNGTFTATFEKVFDWQYEGPPASFSGTMSILTPNATIQEPLLASVYIRRLGTDPHIWNLTTTDTSGTSYLNSWPSYPFISNAGWVRPSPLESTDPTVQTLLSASNIDPSGIIFSSRGKYAYGATVSFTSTTSATTPMNVYLDDMNLKLVGTSWGLLGTDFWGHDIWSQLLYGTRISLEVGLLSAFIGIILGLAVGLMAGYLGKFVDEALMRFTDMLLVIPGLPFLIVLVAVLGNQLGSSRLVVLILVIGFLGWMGFARVVRAQVLSLRERPFVEAAKAAGAGTGHIVTRHVIPNIVGLIYVNLALAVPGAILAEAALSFLGLGDATVITWGRMLGDVQDLQAQSVWWWVIPPGLAIALVSLAFVLIGFSLDTLFNPRLRQRR